MKILELHHSTPSSLKLKPHKILINLLVSDTVGRKNDSCTYAAKPDTIELIAFVAFDLAS